jgi:dimethylargininase
MFKTAIVRTPGRSIINGITTSNLGVPDYGKALEQHQEYIQALKVCGLNVEVLTADEDYPDSTFVEDVALLTPNCAIITNPGAPSRTGEIKSIREVIRDYYNDVEEIQPPGTVEAGDIMMVGEHYFIGRSRRTNAKGAKQVVNILERYGMGGSIIPVKNVVHLKAGVSYLENNNLLVCGEFVRKRAFRKFNLLKIPEKEAYAANCVWINDNVLMPAGFPQVKRIIELAGYATIEVDISEFRKLDGGVSCLSLRF